MAKGENEFELMIQKDNTKKMTPKLEDVITLKTFWWILLGEKDKEEKV